MANLKIGDVLISPDDPRKFVVTEMNDVTVKTIQIVSPVEWMNSKGLRVHSLEELEIGDRIRNIDSGYEYVVAYAERGRYVAVGVKLVGDMKSYRIVE